MINTPQPPKKDDADALKKKLERCTVHTAFNTRPKIPPSNLIDDSKLPSGDTRVMNDITREEFNAKLETIEVKMDARVESVSAKIEAFIAVQAERDKRMEATVDRIDASHDQIKSAFGTMKTTIVVTAVSTVLAIVIGIGGFNAMLTSNMISSFQMGRSEAALVSPKEDLPQMLKSMPSAPEQKK